MHKHAEFLALYSGAFTRPAAEVAADLEVYAALLQKWQRVQNLVSRETLPHVWTRHFLDSLQVLPFIGADDRLILDLGSGGGLPAIPLAIALKGSDTTFALVEPNGRKVSFLRTVARELDLAVKVFPNRSDEIDSRETGRPDVITSRALASLTQLCSMAAPFLGPESRAIFHKGREHVEELAEAADRWHYDMVIRQSTTDPDAVLVEIRNLVEKSGR